MIAQTQFDLPYLGASVAAGPTTGEVAAADWAARVVTNGGAAPSSTTVNAIADFIDGLETNSILSKMLAVNVFAPDNLIASITPIIVGPGNDPWTNHNFVSGDLTVNGLKGNASTKYLDTGVIPSGNLSDDDAGLSMMIFAPDMASTYLDIGVGESSRFFQINVAAGLTDENFGCWGGGTDGLDRVHGTLPTSPFSGFYSGNRTASNALALYIASSAQAFSTLASGSSAKILGNLITTGTVTVLARNTIGSGIQGYSNRTMSFAAIHSGLLATEAQALYDLVRELRGGGGGLTGEVAAADWAARVVTNGGAAPSSTTVNAFANFINGLETDGILSKMIAINGVAPDSLIASITPIIVGPGNDPWTNNNFLLADLSVNGLIGNGSNKYLDTALVPASISSSGFGNTSAGLSMIVTENPGTGNLFEAGCGSASTNSQFQIHVNSTASTLVFACWRFDSPNIVAPSGSPSYTGFLSGSRTAANAIALYGANTGSPFSLLASNTGTQTGSAIATYPLAVFAVNAVGSITNFSNRRLSFLAVHSGLNATETEALYDRTYQLRTDLGGGFV